MKRSSALILGLGLVAAAPAASALTGLSAEWSWIAPAVAAEDVTFDNLSFTIGGATIKIPHIMVTGSSLSKSDLQSLVTGPWGTSTVDLLSKFDATSVVVPEMHFDMSSPVAGKDAPMTQSASYRELRLENIKAGKAAKVSSGGMSDDIQGPVAM